MTEDRLSDRDWVNAGLLALADTGFTALKAAPLAARLKVSRGSFYWHFADVAAFHDAVLRRWGRIAFETVVSTIESRPEDRLRSLLFQAFRADTRLERAVRAWATADPAARAAVAEVDRRRLDYLERLLADAGLQRGAAHLRARILNWAYLGHVLSAEDGAAEVAQDLLAELWRLARMPPQA
ncbi:MAG: TetR/AcrR family transcriptional regulator [Sneathiellaceae bacterium]